MSRQDERDRPAEQPSAVLLIETLKERIAGGDLAEMIHRCSDLSRESASYLIEEVIEDVVECLLSTWAFNLRPMIRPPSDESRLTISEP